LHVSGNAELLLLEVALTGRAFIAIQLPHVVTVAAPGVADGGFIFYTFDGKDPVVDTTHNNM
jgi:hypothetical protein